MKTEQQIRDAFRRQIAALDATNKMSDQNKPSEAGQRGPLSGVGCSAPWYGETDTRSPKGGWAPGGYACKCSGCGKHFVGDKQAFRCAPCTYCDAMLDSEPSGQQTTMKTTSDDGAGLAPMDCSAWWLTGWERKYRTLDNRDDSYVARVFCRLLAADDLYQRKNKMGKYSLPNASDEPRIGAERHSIETNTKPTPANEGHHSPDAGSGTLLAPHFEVWCVPTERNTYSKPRKIGGPYADREHAQEVAYFDRIDEPSPDAGLFYAWEIREVPANGRGQKCPPSQ